MTFELFWRIYPRKTGKLAAQREWQRLKPDEELQRQIETALVWQMPRWTDLKFIPHPLTWLRQGRWLDEPPVLAPPREPWVCRHVEHCSHPEMCKVKDLNPAKYPVTDTVVET